MGRCIVTDNAITTLAAAFTAGVSTVFTVLAGKGSLFGAPSPTHPVRVVGIKQGVQNATGQLTDTTKYAVYRATGRAGDALSGATFESGNAGLSFAVGDTIGVLWTAQGVADLDDDLTAVEAAVAAAVVTPGRGLVAEGYSPFALNSYTGWVIVPCEPTMLPPFGTAVNAVDDAAWATMDLSGLAPRGAVAAQLQGVFYSLGAGGQAPWIRCRPVGFVHDIPNGIAAGGGIIADDAASPVFEGSGQQTVYSYRAGTAVVPLSPDYKFQYKRVLNGGTGLMMLRVTGWGITSGVWIGGAQKVIPGTNVVNSSPNAPVGVIDEVTGNQVVMYFDTDDVAIHSGATYFAMWVTVNRGAPTLLCPLSTFGVGTQALEGWLYQVPGSGRLTIYIISAQDWRHWWSDSFDGGVTWSAPTLATIPATPFGQRLTIPTDVQLSTDGVTLLSAWYGEEPGATNPDTSVALMECDPDGHTWRFRAWISRFATASLGLDETALIRFPRRPGEAHGRLVAEIRAPGIQPAALPGNNGYYAVSDLDGAAGSWSVPVHHAATYPSPWAWPSGFAIGSNRAVIFARFATLSGNPQYSTAWWEIDRTGALLSGPHHFARLSAVAQTGYGGIIPGPEGREHWDGEDFAGIDLDMPGVISLVRRRIIPLLASSGRTTQ